MNYQKNIENNQIRLYGKFIVKPMPHYIATNRWYYRSCLQVPRNDGKGTNNLNVILEDFLAEEVVSGALYKVIGRIQTRNVVIDGKSHVRTCVRILEMTLVDEFPKCSINLGTLRGTICKKPELVVTAKGINKCQVIVATNRITNESDYIQCISFNGIARKVEEFDVGAKVLVRGSLQSRDYAQKMPDGSKKHKTAFEFYISTIEALQEK